MEDQVEEIKRKTDIVAIVGQYVALKKMGRHHKGLCPFHSEKTPSFTVNEELGLYKCFGCGAGGDVISFLMEIEGIDFREALERLADKLGIKLVSRKRDGGDDRQKMFEVLDLAAKYYHWILTESTAGEEARKYLEERKINKKLIDTFEIGFAMSSWDSLINYLVKKKGYSEDLLERVGLVSRKSAGGVYDKFRGRIMFPLQDAGGKVVGFSGRILPSLVKENEPKYMNSPETELYHKGRMLYGFYQAKQAIREKKRVVLVEGQMDLVSSYGAGVAETVAVGGTALTEEQVEMLARLVEKIYFSLDADEAGYAAMKRSVEIAERRGLDIKVVHIEGGKDPDEIARNFPAKWREMVESAVDVYEYVMIRAFEKNDKNTIGGIRKITEEVIPFLTKIENSVVREVWAKRFAERLEVDLKGVLSEIERSKSGRQINEPKSIKKEDEKKSETKIDKLIMRLIKILLSKGDEAKNIIKHWLSGERLPGATGKALIWLIENSENKTPVQILEETPAELKDVVSQAYMSESEMGNDDNLESVLAQAIREVIRERKQVLMEEMAVARSNKDEEKESKMFEELNELNKKESKMMAVLG